MERLINWHKSRHPEIPNRLDNTPLNPQSRLSLEALKQNILTPVEQKFGIVTVSYGFTSLALKKHLLLHHPGQMAPTLDQHAASELNSKGKLICSRQGAAFDFLAGEYAEKMEVIAKFVVEHLPFDRLYFYERTRSVHVSIGPDNSQSVYIMKRCARGHFVPLRRGKGRDSCRLFV